MRELTELADYWETAAANREDFGLHITHPVEDLRLCAQELRDALAKAWPWRESSKELPHIQRRCLAAYDDDDCVLYARTEDDGKGGILWISASDTGSYRMSQPKFWMYVSEVPRPKGGEDEH